MKRKIFNSDESRIKSRIKCKLDFIPCSWWLRSVYNFIYYGDSDSYHYLGYVHFTSHISQIFPDYSFGISPACTI